MAKNDDPQLYSSGYERKKSDRYWTNPWMTWELLNLIRKLFIIRGPIWECAAGRGDISRELAKAGFDVYSSDIDISEFDKTIRPFLESDFLNSSQVPAAGKGFAKSIITNPPYNIADDFVRHGLEFFDANRIEFMAMLLRSEFRCGKTRKDMFGECQHYLGELVLTTRPRWDYGDPNAPEKAAPRHNFSWFLWRKHDNQPAQQFFSYMPKGFKI